MAMIPGRRRTAGLRREEVATLTGVSIDLDCPGHHAEVHIDQRVGLSERLADTLDLDHGATNSG